MSFLAHNGWQRMQKLGEWGNGGGPEVGPQWWQSVWSGCVHRPACRWLQDKRFLCARQQTNGYKDNESFDMKQQMEINEQRNTQNASNRRFENRQFTCYSPRGVDCSRNEVSKDNNSTKTTQKVKTPQADGGSTGHCGACLGYCSRNQWQASLQVKWVGMTMM